MGNFNEKGITLGFGRISPYICVNIKSKSVSLMKNGKVKFFNNAKGFGFIVEEGTQQEIFVHVTGLKDQIRDNDNVTFEVEQGRKGPNAVNVRLA